MECPQCGYTNRTEARFCEACGTPFSRHCPSCQQEVRPGAKFCDQCGYALSAAAPPDTAAPLKEAIIDRFHARLPDYTPRHLTEKILASKSAMEGERKQVTVLFADIAGFTAFSERLDPEEVHLLMDGCFARLTEAVHRYEGTINQYTGDGIMALFGAPIAHEDHPQRALLAALAIQEAVQAYGERLQRDKGIDMRLRIGVNTGLVVVGRIGDNLRMDYTAQGDTTNLAARLQALAEPGTILVSEPTYRLTHGYFTFRSLGARQIKGHTPVQVFEVSGRQVGRSRIDIAAEYGLTSFVGRRRELDLLEALLAKTKGGHGQIVGLVGEAGVGKSRLLLEFRRLLQGEHVTYLEGRCLSYGQSILYLPLVDILKRYFAIEDDSDQRIKERVINGVEQVGLDAAAIAPYLSSLLLGRMDDEMLQELAPEVRRKQTFEALRALLLASSRRQPLVLVVEDLHWLDQPSEAFLTFFGESLGAAPLMLLVTYRPGYQHRWVEKSYYSRITLQPLSEAESGTLIASVLGGAEIPRDLRELISRKGEGNPLYLEEITRSFLEREIIQREGTGYRLRRALTSSDVPETIQDIIVSRLDRLPEHQKRTIQTAAVIGREFAARLLRRIADIQEQLDDCLSELKNLELIYEKNVFPDLEYIFKHVLTQEAAYNSLLSTRRTQLHTAIGLAIEELHQERLAERYEELAHHFTQGEAWEKAFHYLTRSGDKARQAYANHEAIAFYTHAIEVSRRITPALDEARLLPVYEGRGLVWMLQTRYDEAIADFQIMRQLAQASGNPQKEGESLGHLAFVHWAKFSEDQLPFVEQYAQEAMQLFQQTRDQKILARSLTSLGLVHQWRGNLQEADRKLEESLQISRREGYKDSLAQNLLWLSAHAYWQGNSQRAIPLGQEGWAVSRDIHDGFSELISLAFLCLEYWSAGNYAQALHVLHEGMTKAKERDNKFILGRLTNTLGWFHSEFGDISRAVEYDHESMELGRTSGISNVEISALINLGLDYLALGQHARALSYLEPTLERVERGASGAHRWRWKVRLLTGLAELAYTTGAYEQALRYVEEGLGEAQATSSQKYVAKGRALRGKIAVKLGNTEAAGAELQQAFGLGERLQSPSLFYPIAYDLGQWHETRGQEREAAALYSKAKAAIEQMATAVEDQALRAIFLQSARVQAIYERAARTGI
ncbi:MAG: adenylate/guanylate cyclase domain-containing protein [Candidatus Entotheonellia bacterium]